MKKIIAGSILICLFCMVAFSGCSPKKKDLNTITIWHWMTDRDEAFKELATKYEAETGIKVKIDLYAPPNAYTQRIIASTQAHVLPDIFGVLDKKEIFASFIKSEVVADLTEEFAKDDSAWEKSLFAKALDVNRFTEGNIYGVKPGLYGVPLDVTTIQMLYNKKLLKKAGITNPPKTFDEFLGQVNSLRKVGVTPFVSGWGESWLADCFASNYAFNIMGEEKVMATFEGRVPYTDSDWVKVFQLFEQLRDSEALIEGIVTKSNKLAEQDFALERAAFAFNGSWSVNVYHDMNPDLEYAAILPPAIDSEFPITVWGGAGSSFMVAESSPRKAKAIAFLKWLTAEEQQTFLAEKTRNLPSNRKALDSIPEILSNFAAAMDYATHPTIWRLNELALVTEAFDKGIQSIIIGEKTAQEVAEQVQAIKVREMKKNKRFNK